MPTIRQGSLAILVVLSTVLAGCTFPSSPSPAAPGGDAPSPGSAAPAAGAIGPAGGRVESSDGRLTLDVPPGALATPAAISIAQEDAAAWSDALGDRVTPRAAYDLQPDGLRFAKPARLAVRIPMADGEAADAMPLLVPLLRDASGVAALANVTVRAEPGRIVVEADVPHFSKIAAASLGNVWRIHGPEEAYVREAFVGRVEAYVGTGYASQEEAWSDYSAHVRDLRISTEAKRPVAVVQAPEGLRPSSMYESVRGAEVMKIQGHGTYLCEALGTGSIVHDITIGLAFPLAEGSVDSTVNTRVSHDVTCLDFPVHPDATFVGPEGGDVTWVESGVTYHLEIAEGALAHRVRLVPQPVPDVPRGLLAVGGLSLPPFELAEPGAKLTATRARHDGGPTPVAGFVVVAGGVATPVASPQIEATEDEERFSGDLARLGDVVLADHGLGLRVGIAPQVVPVGTWTRGDAVATVAIPITPDNEDDGAFKLLRERAPGIRLEFSYEFPLADTGSSAVDHLDADAAGGSHLVTLRQTDDAECLGVGDGVARVRMRYDAQRSTLPEIVVKRTVRCVAAEEATVIGPAGGIVMWRTGNALYEVVIPAGGLEHDVPLAPVAEEPPAGTEVVAPGFHLPTLPVAGGARVTVTLANDDGRGPVAVPVLVASGQTIMPQEPVVVITPTQTATTGVYDSLGSFRLPATGLSFVLRVFPAEATVGEPVEASLFGEAKAGFTGVAAASYDHVGPTRSTLSENLEALGEPSTTYGFKYLREDRAEMKRVEPIVCTAVGSGSVTTHTLARVGGVEIPVDLTAPVECVALPGSTRVTPDSGGTVTTADGKVSIAIPAGAVRVPTDILVSEGCGDAPGCRTACDAAAPQCVESCAPASDGCVEPCDPTTVGCGYACDEDERGCTEDAYTIRPAGLQLAQPATVQYTGEAAQRGAVPVVGSRGATSIPPATWTQPSGRADLVVTFETRTPGDYIRIVRSDFWLQSQPVADEHVVGVEFETEVTVAYSAPTRDRDQAVGLFEHFLLSFVPSDAAAGAVSRPAEPGPFEQTGPDDGFTVYLTAGSTYVCLEPGSGRVTWTARLQYLERGGGVTDEAAIVATFDHAITCVAPPPPPTVPWTAGEFTYPAGVTYPDGPPIVPPDWGPFDSEGPIALFAGSGHWGAVDLGTGAALHSAATTFDRGAATASHEDGTGFVLLRGSSSMRIEPFDGAGFTGGSTFGSYPRHFVPIGGAAPAAAVLGVGNFQLNVVRATGAGGHGVTTIGAIPGASTYVTAFALGEAGPFLAVTFGNPARLWTIPGTDATQAVEAPFTVADATRLRCAQGVCAIVDSAHGKVLRFSVDANGIPTLLGETTVAAEPLRLAVLGESDRVAFFVGRETPNTLSVLVTDLFGTVISNREFAAPPRCSGPLDVAVVRDAGGARRHGAVVTCWTNGRGFASNLFSLADLMDAEFAWW